MHKTNMRIIFQFIILTGLLFFSPYSFSSEILKNLPDTIDPERKYLFFLHGKIIENKGVNFADSYDYGFYEYNKILDVLAKHGLIVISEPRDSDTKIKRYAKKIATQVRTLLEKGVKPKNITVSGFSKGGKITLVTSSLIGNKDINYVVLAGCIRNTDKFINKFNLDLKGRVLSLVDYNDNFFSSCEDMFNSASGGLKHHEIILQDGGGHGVFYTPDEKWIKPLIDWVKS